MEGLTEIVQTDVAGLYFRSVLLPDVGIRIPQHEHPYDHATLVGSGCARLFIDSVWAGDYEAGKAIEIKANHQHEFIALEPNTRLVCIHHTESAIAAQKVEVASCHGE